MKKTLKILLLTTIVTVVCLCSISAMAYRNGNIIGTASYTDICASINGYGIASYNVDGYTYVIAEDLRNYGFEVIWNPSLRTLSITRNSVYYPSVSYTQPFIVQSLVGEKSHNLLYTDIKTYVNNSPVQSYNINGRTIIRFDSLNAFGGVIWTAESKEILLEMPDFATKPVDINKYNLKMSYIERTRQIEKNEKVLIDKAFSQYELNMATYEIYMQWDNLLNDVYQYLKTTLPYSEFSQLQEDEYAWVKEKESAFEAEYNSWNGGSAAPMAANGVRTAYTQDRCYYLISLIKP